LTKEAKRSDLLTSTIFKSCGSESMAAEAPPSQLAPGGGTAPGATNELWQTVVDASKLVLTSCKLVAEAVGKPSDPDGLYAATDQAEVHAAALVDLVRSSVFSEQWPVVSRFLYEAAIGTSSAVADLTRAAKAALANPYDFLTTQAVGNSTRAVADAIKSVVQAAEPLKRAAAAPVSGGPAAPFRLPYATTASATSSTATPATPALSTELPATEAGLKVSNLSLCDSIYCTHTHSLS